MKTNNPYKPVYSGNSVNTKSSCNSYQSAKEQRRNMTSAETRLWACLRANRLNGMHFRRKHVLYGYIVDFYCHSASLVIDIEEGAYTQNNAGDSFLSAHGITILHIQSEHIEKELCKVLSEIQKAVDVTANRCDEEQNNGFIKNETIITKITNSDELNKSYNAITTRQSVSHTNNCTNLYHKR